MSSKVIAVSVAGLLHVACTPTDRQPASDASRSSAREDAATEASELAQDNGDRCARLPALPRPGPKWSPTNSDGTSKRLPPPPPSTPGETLLFRYADFGPQALAGRLLGPDWWSWEAGGSFEPGDAFDVRVVVYDGIDEARVRARFPTVRGRSDYRLVTREAALAYVDDALSELRSFVPAERLTSLEDRLAKTRDLIDECFGNDPNNG